MPIEILMPALSPTMTEGNLAKWLKKEGDKISPGDVIAEIETDKATMEVEAVDSGIMGRILIQEKTENVAINTVIAILLAEGENKKSLDSWKVTEVKKEKSDVKEAKQEQKITQAPVTSSPIPQIKSPIQQESKKNDRIKASPLARKIAEQSGVDIKSIKGTGPDGRIIKDDVEDALQYQGNRKSLGRNQVEFTTIPNSNIRKTIAKRLTESKQLIPHFYLTIDCNLDMLNEVRAQINKNAEKQAINNLPYKVSVNDLLIKASALALKDNPAANSSWYDDAIVRYNNVDISVAVATDSGLITPIIRNADQKSVIDISLEVKELVKKAKANQLMPEEYQGGGFSISNLGMYGIKKFSAIINPPQSCILAIGMAEERAIIKDGKIEAANILSVTLSVDHRAVDGKIGAEFLASFKNYVEQPVLLFL